MMERIAVYKKPFYIAFFTFLVLTLSGCALIGRDNGGGGTDISIFGATETLTGNATLVCSQDCIDRGFCGSIDGQQSVILLNTQRPATQSYDLFMLNNSPVTITAVEQRIVTYQVNLVNETVNYYLVSNAELQQGWVAGWCVGQ